MELDHNETKELIEKFCGIILTKSDTVNETELRNYIKTLTADQKRMLNDNCNIGIRTIIQQQINIYLSTFVNFTIEKPFEFASDEAYAKINETCVQVYKDNSDGAPLPEALKQTLVQIQEISEHYKIFGYFYNVRVKETANEILKDMENTAAEKAQAAVSAATNEAAEQAVNKVIETKTQELTRKTTETSVTILGMFTGIVLTVVAGLFYSSSVLENISNVNFGILISAVALVGLVCIHLIALMFRFIVQISNSSNNNAGLSDKVLKIISVALGITMIFGVILHCVSSLFLNTEINTHNDLNVNLTVDTQAYETSVSAIVTEVSVTEATEMKTEATETTVSSMETEIVTATTLSTTTE